MSRTARKMSLWLKITGSIYALGAVDFIARPKGAVEALNRPGGDPIEPEEPEGLFNSLAAAYMATIAAIALSASTDPEDRAVLIPPLLVAKATSSGAMLYRYLTTKKMGFAYGAALDALLLGVTAGLYNSLDRR